MGRGAVVVPDNPRIPNEWIPRSDQRKLWDYLESGGKRAVEVAHRRWGKDDVALHFTATAMVNRVGNYWHMLPEYSQARKSVWDAVNVRTGRKRIDDAFPEWLRDNTRETDMFIRLKNGSTWQLVGSDNYNSLVGSPPIGVVFSEWALANPMCWPFLMPILVENGGWALWITTPRGNNHAKQTLDYARVTDGWYGEILKADQTPVFTKLELEDIRAELIAVYGQEQGEALFQQEYFCSFEGSILGSYFGKQMASAREEGRICSVPWQSGQEVYTCWDLGIDDSMSIGFFQPIGKSFHFIDYYESSGYGLEHYAKVLKDKPYAYGGHYMPHDAEQREMTNSEIALSRREVAESLNIKPISVVNRVRNMDTKINVHIPAARNMIGQCWFDEKKCSGLISALEGYRTEYDDAKKKLGNRPVHDWTCLAGDTRIRTLKGWKRIADLVGEDFYVWGYSTEQHRLVPAKAEKCWLAKTSTENIKIVLNNRNSIICTADHRFLTRDERWVCAEDLTPGTSLMPFYEREESSRGYTRIHLTDGSIADEHKFVFQWFNGFILDGMHIHHDDSDKENCSPENLKQLTIAEHISIHAKEPERLAKLIKNGCKNKRNGEDISREQLAYHKARREQGILMTQQKPGFYTEAMREKTRETVVKNFKASECEKICLGCGGTYIGNWKRRYCCVRCIRSSRPTKSGVMRWANLHDSTCTLVLQEVNVANHKVSRVERISEPIDVYDISVPGINSFVAEGVVVHNSHGADCFLTFAVGYQPPIVIKPTTRLTGVNIGPQSWMM